MLSHCKYSYDRSCVETHAKITVLVYIHWLARVNGSHGRIVVIVVIVNYMLETTILCYRLNSLMPYDEEEIWSLVQSVGGYLSIRGDCIDYWVPRPYAVFLVLKYPGLERRADLDYI